MMHPSLRPPLLRSLKSNKPSSNPRKRPKSLNSPRLMTRRATMMRKLPIPMRMKMLS